MIGHKTYITITPSTQMLLKLLKIASVLGHSVINGSSPSFFSDHERAKCVTHICLDTQKQKNFAGQLHCVRSDSGAIPVDYIHVDLEGFKKLLHKYRPKREE